MNRIFKPFCLIVIAVGGLLTGSAGAGTLVNYESFGNASDGSSVNNYQSTTFGYSVALNGAWSELNNNGAALKHRTSSTGWTVAQNNLTAIGSTLAIQNGGYFNFLECSSWGFERAKVALATPIDMTTNGTWYMSFCSSSGDFNYAAQMGLNDGTNELMWGNGYSGGGQGLAAHYASMSAVTAGSIKGSSGVSPAMSAGFDVILYVAQLQQNSGAVTVKIYGYDLNTTTGLPSDITTAGAPLWSTTLSGVNTRFTNLELELSGQSQYPDIAQLRVGTTWAGVTAGQPIANQLWTGGGPDNNWSTSANWLSENPPNIGDNVTFAGTAQLTANMNSGFSLGSLTFSNNAGSFIITNTSYSLTLTGGVTNNSINAQTVNVPVILNTTQPINAAAGNLTFGQNVVNNGSNVTFAGSGNITINGTLSGSGGVVQTGSGTITIPMPLSYSPWTSYMGSTLIQSGTVALSNPGYWVSTNTFSGAGNLMVSGAGPLFLWGANNLSGTTTVSNGTLFVGLVPNQSLGSTIHVLDGATFGVTARADTYYVSPANLILGSSTGATLEFGMQGISEPGLTGTNNAPIRATNVTIHGTATINVVSCPFAANSYPLFTGYSSGTLALGSQPAGYQGKLTVNAGTVCYTVTNLDYNYRPFVHPGCMNVAADFARMRAKVNAGAHPWIDSYNLLVANSGSQSNVVNHVQQQIYRNASGGNYQFIAWDAQAAYELSLRWMITGDNNYADRAVSILNAWANTCTNITGDPNAFLIALNGYQFACAAENMHTYTNWASADLARFQLWFRYGPTPGVTTNLSANWWNAWWVGGPENMINTHLGQCPEYDWANWDLCSMDELLAIAVFCDDRSLYNYTLNYYKTGYAGWSGSISSIQGNGTANRVIYHTHPGYMGQWQEAGRDQGHAMMGPALLGTFCEIAWNQGDDIFSYYTNQLLTGAEYESKWNEQPETVVENNSIPLVLESNTVPYVTYMNCAGDRQTDLAAASRGNVRMGWDLIYNHYVNIMGVDAPYTGVYMSQTRPEGIGDNDVIGYTTLTHYLDPIPPASIPTPSAVIAQVNNTAATISWIGSAYATGYNVKRSTNNGASYTTVASGITMDHYYTDTGLIPGSNYLYAVSAIVNGVETTNSLPVIVQANELLSGTIIGSSGSYDCCSTIYRVFDGALGSFYDAANASGDWAGLDLGASNMITKVGYCPRPGFPGRMVGGQFQGCNVPDFSSGVVTLYTITSQPADLVPQVITYQTISNPGSFRYVRYIGPANGSCNVAEVQFYGFPAPGQMGPVQATAGDSQVTLSWSPMADATGYMVKSSTTDGGPYSLVASPSQAGCTVGGLANGTLYYFVVSATNSAGLGSDSAQVSARPVSMTSTNVTFGISGSQLQLSWPADHTGWRLQMNTNLTGGNWIDVSGATSSNSISISPTNGNAFYRLTYP